MYIGVRPPNVEKAAETTGCRLSCCWAVRREIVLDHSPGTATFSRFARFANDPSMRSLKIAARSAALDERILESDPLVLAIADAYPVSAGHTLIVPRRHVVDFFELTVEEIRSVCLPCRRSILRGWSVHAVAVGTVVCTLSSPTMKRWWMRKTPFSFAPVGARFLGPGVIRSNRRGDETAVLIHAEFPPGGCVCCADVPHCPGGVSIENIGQHCPVPDKSGILAVHEPPHAFLDVFIGKRTTDAGNERVGRFASRYR